MRDEYWGPCFPWYPGTNGTMERDPLVCNLDAGDLTINENSPCAPEHSGSCGLIGALPVGCPLTGVGDPATGPATGSITVAPNPARIACQIRWSPASAGEAQIFSASGRLLRRFATASSASAGHPMTWDFRDSDGARVPSGVYFVRVPGQRPAVPVVVVR